MRQLQIELLWSPDDKECQMVEGLRLQDTHATKSIQMQYLLQNLAMFVMDTFCRDSFKRL